MKRVLVVLAFGGLLLLLVGPVHDGFGRILTSLPGFRMFDSKDQRASRPSSKNVPSSSVSQPSTRSQEAKNPQITLAQEEVRTAILEYRLRSVDRIKKVQRALKKAGFDPGPIDGKLGPMTEGALVEFQQARGLEPDGIVGMKTWTALSEYLESGSALAQEHAAFQD